MRGEDPPSTAYPYLILVRLPCPMLPLLLSLLCLLVSGKLLGHSDHCSTPHSYPYPYHIIFYHLYLTILLLPLSLVQAFHIPKVSKVTSSLKMADEMVGASIEAGGKVFDPLGVLEMHKINNDVLPHPKWWRESELKHCRVAMLASIGAFASQFGLTIPGYTAVADPVENLNQ
jgi:hypothetical protein